MTTVPGSVPGAATARRVSHVGTRPRSSGRQGKILCGTTAGSPREAPAAAPDYAGYHVGGRGVPIDPADFLYSREPE